MACLTRPRVSGGRLSTAEIMRYFEDFAPSFVLWLNDSSANVVFGDPANARRAYITVRPVPRTPPLPHARRCVGRTVGGGEREKEKER